MPTIREKRVYDEARPPTPVFVAAAQGLVVAWLSDDAVGEFGLARRGPIRDVAVGADGTLALATEEAALVAPDADPDRLRETGFGPAIAVSVIDATEPAIVAADESGRIARLSIAEGVPEDPNVDWTDLGSVDDVHAIDGSLVAAGDGVRRITDAGLDDAGLDDARDVAARGAPLAATGAGLYELGNGWMLAREGAHETVATDGERAHAVAVDRTVLGRDSGGGDWSDLDLPTDDSIVDFGYTDEAVVAATESGSLLTSAGDGWRSRAVGVTGVRSIAAGQPPATE
ncbi:MAG: HVO_0234 family beta-propeller protein [Halolamina sp.]